MSDHTYTIYRCPECGKQAGHFSATTCQHFDPDERYIQMEEVQVIVRDDVLEFIFRLEEEREPYVNWVHGMVDRRFPAVKID